VTPPDEPAPLTPDQQALVTKHSGIVTQTAAGFAAKYSRYIGEDELRAYGRMGLVRAAQNYDETRGEFEAHAIARVRWAIWDGIREEIPHLRALAAAGKAACELLDAPGPRENIMQDNAEVYRERADACEAGVVGTMLAGYSYAGARMGEDWLVARAMLRRIVSAVTDAMSYLSDRERALLGLHYGEELTLVDAAARLGIPYSTAKKTHRATIERLAKYVRQAGIPEARPG